MNYCIIDKKPQKFQDIIIDSQGIKIDEILEIKVADIYVCFYYEGLKNITLVVKNRQVYSVTLILKETKEYKKILNSLQEELANVQFSQQDKKINGYAAAIIEKLREGIETGIVDAVEEKNVKCCPVCGMECDPNIPYCMECGTEV